MKKKQSTAKDQSYKKTREELQGLPFETVREKKKAEDDIHLANWKRLTSYKSFQELIKRNEFDEIQQELSTGFICRYSDTNTPTDSIMRVHKAPIGIEVLIDHKKSISNELISSLAKGLSESFGTLYYSIGGLLQNEISNRELQDEQFNR